MLSSRLSVAKGGRFDSHGSCTGGASNLNTRKYVSLKKVSSSVMHVENLEFPHRSAMSASTFTEHDVAESHARQHLDVWTSSDGR